MLKIIFYIRKLVAKAVSILPSSLEVPCLNFHMSDCLGIWLGPIQTVIINFLKQCMIH